MLPIAALQPTRRDEVILRWVPRLYVGMALALIPWITYLGVTLPDRATNAHYDLSWVGFDVLLAILILRTAYLAARRRPQAELPAVATATMLLIDAWFDITTSPTHDQFVVALILAGVGEIPMALMCAIFVRRIERRRAQVMDEVRTVLTDHFVHEHPAELAAGIDTSTPLSC
jgi:hypothetical protein